MKIRRALLSVYDKTGLVEFARALADMGVELVSTGNTARTLTEAGLQVISVAEVTGCPEMLDGRVKTLHPSIHGGILARRDNPGHMAVLDQQGISTIDLVAVNLYPFADTVADPACTQDLALENIDIGGPSMLRSAAKNFPAVIPVCNPGDYEEVVAALKSSGDVSQEARHKLALTAFAHTAAYDAAIAAWLGRDQVLPQQLILSAEKGSDLRYGENPHQEAGLYRLPGNQSALAWVEPLQGKELSYNNYNDAQAALALVSEFKVPAAVAVKHAVPCGVGLGESPAQAFARAREADPVSIFGGIIAFNTPVDAETARLTGEVFLEVIFAPEFTPEARAILAKKKNLRLLPCPQQIQADWEVKTISGGILIQRVDQGYESSWQAVGNVQPQSGWEEAGRLAWLTAKHAKSNAIVVAGEGMTLGIGSGCTSRILAARMALSAAGSKASGAVLASDGFIPFADVVEEAAQAGISVIIQPGGSKGDEDTIAAANKHGIAMIFAGMRHFRH